MLKSLLWCNGVADFQARLYGTEPSSCQVQGARGDFEAPWVDACQSQQMPIVAIIAQPHSRLAAVGTRGRVVNFEMNCPRQQVPVGIYYVRCRDACALHVEYGRMGSQWMRPDKACQIGTG